MIIDHNHPEYIKKWERLSKGGKHNGAWYYSKEIVDKIIPKIKTDRNWITVNLPGIGVDHSIIFIHNNLHPERYEWLSQYDDLILICGVKETCKKVSHLGKAIYLPLSVDVKEIEQYKTEKTKDTCFVGRKVKASWGSVPEGTDFLCGMPREELLAELAKYEKAFAVGRCAVEARILCCEVLAYDPRYPDPSIWKIYDYKKAAKKLQKELDKIDKEKK